MWIYRQFKDFSKFIYVIGIVFTLLSFVKFGKNEALEDCIKWSLITTVTYLIGVILDVAADIILYRKLNKK